MWVQCHTCKGTGINPDSKNSKQKYHIDTDILFTHCYPCFIWYIMSTQQKGMIWVDDSEDPISPLPSP